MYWLDIDQNENLNYHVKPAHLCQILVDGKIKSICWFLPDLLNFQSSILKLKSSMISDLINVHDVKMNTL
jgi:hypothetical protein